MTSREAAISAAKAVLSGKENKIQWQTGFLGDGHGQVLTARANYYLVRYPYENSPAVPVYCSGNIVAVDGLGVIVGYLPWEPGIFQIITYSDQRLSNNDSSTGGSSENPLPPGGGGIGYNPSIGLHWVNHQYLGIDPASINWRQITPLGVFPTNPATMFVSVRSGYIPRPGTDIFVQTQTVDLSGSVPTSGARYALISFDAAGAVIVTDGAINAGGFAALTAADIPNTPAGNWRSCAVVLYRGQTSVVETRNEIDFYDLRFPEEQAAGLLLAAGSNTNIQYNDGGVLGADGNFTWDKLTSALTLTGQAGSLFAGYALISGLSSATSIGLAITAGDAAVSSGLPGNSLFISAGLGDGVGDGGSLVMNAGDGSPGGFYRMNAGNALAGSNEDGGYFAIIGGDADGAGTGGYVNLLGGSGTIGGDVFLEPGPGTSTHGKIFLVNPANVKQAELDVSLIASTDKIFTFPNASGTIALLSTANVFTADQTIQFSNLKFIPVSKPTAPSGALAGAGAGNVDNGDHYYAVTFVTATGETELGAYSSVVTVANKTVNGKVDLTSIPIATEPVVTGRNIYRTQANPTGRFPMYLLTTISNNSATTYQDNTADASLGAVPSQERENTTAGLIYVGGIRAGIIGQSHDTALGFETLLNTTGGGGNSALGWRAAKSITSGTFNAAIGFQALASMQTGSWNVAIGDSALNASTTGTGNLGIGWSALLVNTGDYNVAFGYGAMLSNTSSSNTLAAGALALQSNIDGALNVALGAQAMRLSVHGGANTAVGANVLFNSLGDSNSVVGALGFYNIGSGNNNTGIGESAGYTNTGGSGNVFLGFHAGYYETGSNTLFIDNASRASEADARIKALLYGGFNAAPTSQFLTVNGVVNVQTTSPTFNMIDTTASAKSLTIAVDGNSAAFRETAGAAASLMVLDLANNRMGIGVAPSRILHIQDASDLSIFRFAKSAANYGKYVLFEFTTGASIKYQFGIDGDLGATTDKLSIYDGAAAIYPFVISGGKTGIGGVTSPTARLHLAAGTTTANTAPLKLTTQASALTTVEQGTFELVGNSLQFTQLAKRRGVAMTQSPMTADFQLVSSNAESAAIITAEHGANYLEVGKCEEIVLRGTIQKDVGGPTNKLSIRVKYAGTTIQTTTTTDAAIAAGTPIEIRVTTTCRSTGGTGSMQINTVMWIDGFANIPDSATLVSPIDTTTAQNTTITAQFTNSSATNNLVIHQGRVLCIEPNR